MIQAYKTLVNARQLVRFCLRGARSLLAHGIVVLFVLLTADIGHAEVLRSQVLDAESGKPIAGAVVLGVWTKKAGLPGLHHTDLVGVKEVETNDQGWFELEKPAGPFHEDGESVTVYKPGYVAWNNLHEFPSIKRRPEGHIPNRIQLSLFSADQSHKRHLNFIDDARLSLFYDGKLVPKLSAALSEERKLR